MIWIFCFEKKTYVRVKTQWSSLYSSKSVDLFINIQSWSDFKNSPKSDIYFSRSHSSSALTFWYLIRIFQNTCSVFFSRLFNTLKYRFQQTHKKWKQQFSYLQHLLTRSRWLLHQGRKSSCCTYMTCTAFDHSIVFCFY